MSMVLSCNGYSLPHYIKSFFVIKYFKKQCFRKFFNYSINLINDQNNWQNNWWPKSSIVTALIHSPFFSYGVQRNRTRRGGGARPLTRWLKKSSNSLKKKCRSRRPSSRDTIRSAFPSVYLSVFWFSLCASLWLSAWQNVSSLLSFSMSTHLFHNITFMFFLSLVLRPWFQCFRWELIAFLLFICDSVV